MHPLYEKLEHLPQGVHGEFRWGWILWRDRGGNKILQTVGFEDIEVPFDPSLDLFRQKVMAKWLDVGIWRFVPDCCTTHGVPIAIDVLPPKGVLQFQHGDSVCSDEAWWVKAGYDIPLERFRWLI